MNRHTAIIALTSALAAAPSISAAQKLDMYTIPAKSKYSLLSFAGKKPLTRAERTNFLETSHYDDVTAFIDSLKALGAKIATGSIGTTIEGRAVPYVIASRPLVSTPAEARRLGRPIAYIQANIHSGEVEGKEAMLAMLRDLTLNPKPNVLDSIVLIVIPDYNADGNEKFGPQARNRGEQDGPEMVGTRANAQNLNLNRDYMKAEAPETRGSFAMFNAWNPDVFMDLHTTDGSIHGYSLTYSPSLLPAAVTVMKYETQNLLPTIRQRVRDRDGFEIYDYGDFSRARGAGPGAGGAAPGGGRGRAGASLENIVADSIPTGGWTFSTYEHTPRYGTNYYGLRGRISVLSEAFSHDPFSRRIASTYDFVSEILSYTAEHSKEIMDLGKQSDASLKAWGDNPLTSPDIELHARMDTTRIDNIRVEALVPSGDTGKSEPGMRAGQKRTGEIKLVKMPAMVSFTPTLTRKLPYAWVFPKDGNDSVVALLKTHGVIVETVSAPASVSAQAFTVDTMRKAPTPYEGHAEMKIAGHWNGAAPQSVPAGWNVVRAGQPLGLLAFYLLEPESDDGLADWNFFDSQLGVGKTFPVLRVATPAKISSK